MLHSNYKADIPQGVPCSAVGWVVANLNTENLTGAYGSYHFQQQ